MQRRTMEASQSRWMHMHARTQSVVVRSAGAPAHVEKLQRRRRDSNARAVREDSGVQASARRRTHRHWSLGLQPDAMYCTRSSLVRMLTSCAAAARTARRPA